MLYLELEEQAIFQSRMGADEHRLVNLEAISSFRQPSQKRAAPGDMKDAQRPRGFIMRIELDSIP